MEQRINIAELLKDCPKGMELDCTIFDGVTLYRIDVSPENEYPIRIETKNGYFFDLTKHGTYSDIEDAKCVIFPKGKTTWEEFQRPFKDGDVIADNDNEYIAILHKLDKISGGVRNDVVYYHCWCKKNGDSKFKIDFGIGHASDFRFATEEEKQKLLDAIKANGYKWNEETKTLEKLIEPKFKVGDKIVKRNSIINPYIVSSVSSEYYGLKLPNRSEIDVLSVSEQDYWELVISILRPFDNCRYSLDKGKTWKFAQYWYIQDNYHVNDIEIELWPD